MFFFDLLIFSERPTTDRPAVGARDQRDRRRDRPRPAKPVAGVVAVGLVADHALRDQAGERLVEVEIAAAPQRPGEEARVEQVQDGVLDAADVLVDRQPVIDVRRDRRRRRAAASRSGRSTRTIRRRCRRCRSRARPRRRSAGRPRASRSGWRSSGLPGRPKSTSSGSVTGSSASGTGTMPQAAQWMTGIGQPQ